jgi:hypothetical protein
MPVLLLLLQLLPLLLCSSVVLGSGPTAEHAVSRQPSSHDIISTSITTSLLTTIAEHDFVTYIGNRTVDGQRTDMVSMYAFTTGVNLLQ